MSSKKLPPKWRWTEKWIKDPPKKKAANDVTFVRLFQENEPYGDFPKFIFDGEKNILYWWSCRSVDGFPIHSDAFALIPEEDISWSMADDQRERWAWGLTVDQDDEYLKSPYELPLDDRRKVMIYDTHGNGELNQEAIDAVRQWALFEKDAATSEDTEPVGKQVGFLQDPHEELYPCLFRGEDSIPQDIIDTLKNHVLEPLSERFGEPDAWIAFSIYGSGISYNWDEQGDMDIQMWVNMEEFLRYNFDEDMDQDELLSEIRKIVQQVNFPAFKDLGLTHEDCEGNMLIQYYPKPGIGSKEENLASKPYACFDMDSRTWLQKPITLKPKFYGETFLMLMPKAEEIAKQAEALLADYKRDILNWEFWDLLYRKHKKKEFKEQLDQTIEDAEQRKDGIVNMFQGIFGGRAEAYSPGGKGVKDERDIMQKLLEVWGIFQELKHYAREPFPWEIEIPEHTAAIPHMDELSPHRYDAECYEVAYAISKQWPNLEMDSGYYIHPKRGPRDHAWNIAPDGTIIDMTAKQHDYLGPRDEASWDEVSPPDHPEIIRPGDPEYERYISWVRHEEQAQQIARDMGHQSKTAAPGVNFCWYNDGNQASEWIQMGNTVYGLCKDHSAMYWAGLLPEVPREEMENKKLKKQNPWVGDWKGLKKKDRKKLVYEGAIKTAEWPDVVEKAQRYYAEGRVELLNNMPDHSIANVRGDTGTWQTEIWRQDPQRPNVLSGWSCTCPWGEHSWGRTRIWKRYEGRPCAHTVVLSWESQRQPWDVDEQGNEQLELFDAQQQPGRSFEQYMQDIPRATPPAGSPNLTLIEQLTIPGTFSSWRRVSGTEIIDLPDYLDIHSFDSRENPWRKTLVYSPKLDRMYLAPNNAFHTSIYDWIYENDPKIYQEMSEEPNMHGILEGNILYAVDQDFPEHVVSSLEGHLLKPLIQKPFIPPRDIRDDWFGDEDDYHENSLGEQPWWEWNRTAAFANGGFVKNKVKMFGMDDRGDSYAIPRNTVGEVLYSDDITTIAIFNLKSGPLGAHLIRVEDSTDKFSPAPKNILDRGPAPRRNAPNA